MLRWLDYKTVQRHGKVAVKIAIKCYCWSINRQERVLRQQVMIFTLNVCIFKNGAARIKEKRKRSSFVWIVLTSYPNDDYFSFLYFSLICIQTGAFKLLWTPSCFTYWGAVPSHPLMKSWNPILSDYGTHNPCWMLVTPPHTHTPSNAGIPAPWDVGDPTPTVWWNMGMNLHVVLCACGQGHLRPAPQGLPSYLYWLKFHFGEVGFLRHEPQFYHLRFAELNLIRSVLQKQYSICQKSVERIDKTQTKLNRKSKTHVYLVLDHILQVPEALLEVFVFLLQFVVDRLLLFLPVNRVVRDICQ